MKAASVSQWLEESLVRALRVLLLCFAAVSLGLGVGTAAHNHRSRMQGQWPEVSGVITSLRPLRYRYEVAGRVYEGTRAHDLLAGGSKPYDLGQPVNVHFDPRRPAHAVLSVGSLQRGSAVGYALAVSLTLLALFLGPLLRLLR